MLIIVFAGGAACAFLIATAVMFGSARKAVGVAPRIPGNAGENSVHEARWLIGPIFVLALAFAILLAVSS